ncbi:MAG: peptidase [Pirellulales bacterium]
MFLEPSTSDYDLRFNFFGFPTRVTWTFWLAGAVLGWSWSQSLDAVARIAGLDSPGPPALLLIWIGCVFVSILIHELGHALAFRQFGQRAYIVLYHFGGLAVNDSYTSWDGARRSRTSPKEDLIISAAGPAAQLLLALIVGVIGYKLGMYSSWITQLLGLPPIRAGEMTSITQLAFFDALVTTSVFWALINLAPVLPMDGGNIMYNLMIMYGARDAWLLSRQVSIGVSIVMGLVFARLFGGTNGIMFFLFAAMNWQEIQQGRRGF